MEEHQEKLRRLVENIAAAQKELDQARKDLQHVLNEKEELEGVNRSLQQEELALRVRPTTWALQCACPCLHPNRKVETPKSTIPEQTTYMLVGLCAAALLRTSTGPQVLLPCPRAGSGRLLAQ